MQPKIVFNDKNEAGTTLVELLAAIAILSIIVTAFLAFFVQGARTNSRTDDLTQATFIAQQEMEEIVYYSQNISVDSLVNDEGFSGNDPYTRRKNDSGFIIDSTVTKANDNEESRLFKVVVEVSNGDQTQALMENRLFFRSEDD